MAIEESRAPYVRLDCFASLEKTAKPKCKFALAQVGCGR